MPTARRLQHIIDVGGEHVTPRAPMHWRAELFPALTTRDSQRLNVEQNQREIRHSAWLCSHFQRELQTGEV